MRFLSLDELVAAFVKDGQTLAMEGFTHLIPYAAAHELIRQGRRDLHLVRMTPDLIYDQLIGAGCARALTFSWGGNPGVGSLHRLRDAVENAWPGPLELHEHSHAGMAAAYTAGAARLPFGMLRGYLGTDLDGVNPQVRRVACPYTGELLATVPALNPDVTILHAQKADRHGNVLLEGIIGAQKEAALAARTLLVTVEERVEELGAPMNAVIIPGFAVTAVAQVPHGAHPSYAHGLYPRDNAFCRAWDEVARTREGFLRWLDTHVRGTRDHAGFLASLKEDKVGADVTPDEMMTIAAARSLRNGAVCFVGIGLPSAAANLARLTHAPDLVLIYESGTIGSRPSVLPLSIGDGELAATATVVVPLPEIFAYWLQAGRIDVGFLGAAQIDRFGNLNSTVIGPYVKPSTRLPGAGGAPEIAAHARETFVVLKQNPRTFVPALAFRTSMGYLAGSGSRSRTGARGAGPTQVITDLGILRPARDTQELELACRFEGVSVERIVAATGWPLRVADRVEVAPPPTHEELAVLRDLNARTRAAHEKSVLPAI